MARVRADLRISRPEAFAPLTSPASQAEGRQAMYSTRQWQSMAWDAYDEVPESHATTAFIAACLSRLKFKLAWIGDDDDPGDVWDEDGVVKEGIDPLAAELGRSLVRSLRAKRGGSTRFLAKIGANIAQVGDLSVVPRQLGQRRYFDAYSVDELKPQADGTWIRYAGPGRQAEIFGRNADGKLPLVIRIHREHPRFSEWADSGTRALLPTLELMRLLTQEMRSSTVSRLKGPGILLVSEDADLPPDPNDPTREGLTAQLATVGAVAIGDPGSAAAQVPIIVRVPGEVVEKGMKHIPFSAGDLDTIAKRADAVNTFARGAELPVEQVIGMANANHWGAWMIDETTAKVYIDPLMEAIDGILTDLYLLPSFANRVPALDPSTYEGFCIHYDDTALVAHPDRSAAAQEAFGTARNPNFAISFQTYREARGFNEGDAPDDDEIELRMQQAERLNARRLATDPGNDIPPEGGPGAVKPGPPATGGAEAEVLARISAAIEVAAERAVDRLGARVRAAANGKLSPAQAAAVVGQPSREVPLLLGAEAVAQVIPPAEHFTGEFVALERTVTRWMNGDPNGARIARNCTIAAEALARALTVSPTASIDPSSLAACLKG